jgi:hypothetical protein
VASEEKGRWMKLHHPELYLSRYEDAIKQSEISYKKGFEYYFGEGFYSAIRDSIPLGIYVYPGLEDIYLSSSNKGSYVLLNSCEMFTRFFLQLSSVVKSICSSSYCADEEVITALKYAYSIISWKSSRSRIYEVHPDLSWALQRTELLDFPTDDLQLPHASIYLELPTTLVIPNRETGNHPCLGAFISEETLGSDRLWRMFLIGGPSGTPESNRYVESFGYDDAFFHYWISLREPTVQQCIDYQLDATMNGGIETYTHGGTRYRVNVQSLQFESKHIKIFNESLRTTFRYIMNCAIYATMSESDVLFYEASKEYRDLKDRAMAARGEKRKRLFSLLKNTKSRPRYILGSKLVIDRKIPKDSSLIAGSKPLTKGSMVMGHWQRYWVGEGRKQCIRKLRLPFWRGPVGDTIVQESRHVTTLK